MDGRKEFGSRGEDAAAAYLEDRGVRIRERNFRSRYGEIDLLGQDGKYLIVVEVKSRKKTTSGMPAESVDYRKIMKICRTFNQYRMRHRIPEDRPVRFDVIEVSPGNDGYECHWIKNAFDFIE